MDVDSITLSVRQPSARRREWHFEHAGEVLAHLWIPPLRTGARAEVQGEQLRIVHSRRSRSDYVVRAEATGEDVAHLQRDGRRLFLDQAGSSTVEWQRLDRQANSGFGFVGLDGKPVVRAKIRSGLIRNSGEVEIAGADIKRDALVEALLAVYLLIRRNEEEAAAAATTAVVVAS